MQDSQTRQLHRDAAKLLERGVKEEFLTNSDITPAQARDLVKGLLYLRERNMERRGAGQ